MVGKSKMQHEEVVDPRGDIKAVAVKVNEEDRPDEAGAQARRSAATADRRGVAYGIERGGEHCISGVDPFLVGGSTASDCLSFLRERCGGRSSHGEFPFCFTQPEKE